MYVSTASELQTHEALEAEFSAEAAPARVVAVPRCETDPQGVPRLRCWHVTAMSDLDFGRYGILEPKPAIVADPQRIILPQQIDVAVVPGIAFTRHGDRLGNGYGYYDRLLVQLRPDCQKIGLCFESQIVPALPSDPHDIRVDQLVTERGCYDCASFPPGEG